MVVRGSIPVMFPITVSAVARAQIISKGSRAVRWRQNDLGDVLRSRTWSRDRETVRNSIPTTTIVGISI